MPDNATKYDGGRWALSGFLYQAVILGGYIAYSHNVAHHDLSDSELSALVEVNGIIPELFDQDGVTISPIAPDQCVFYQVKFSGAASTQTLDSEEFKGHLSGAHEVPRKKKRKFINMCL